MWSHKMVFLQFVNIFIVNAETPNVQFSRTESNCRIGTASFDISTCNAQVRIKARHLHIGFLVLI